MLTPKKYIAIAGRTKDTIYYEKALFKQNIAYITTISTGDLENASGLILPGGGDITPSFFGEKNTCSKAIDTELDILQFRALELFIKKNKPVLGICKGLQLINIYFGGNIYQDLPTASFHQYTTQDQFHPTTIEKNTILFSLYGPSLIVNSAHHQGIKKIGSDLNAIQWADDGVIEGIYHTKHPILGVQWHPERLLNGALLFSHFVSLVS